MVNAGEKVPHIAFQNPAFGGPVLPPVVRHKLLQKIQPIVHTLVNLGGAVGRNETPGDRLVQSVVHNGVLHHFVHEGGRLDQAALGLVDVENLEFAGNIEVGVQDVGQSLREHEGVCLILRRAEFLPLSLPGREVGAVQHLEGADFFKSLLHRNSEGRPPSQSNGAALFPQRRGGVLPDGNPEGLPASA